MRLNSIVIFPGNDPTTVVDSSGTRVISSRQANAFDRFANALSKSSSPHVWIDEELELPLPAEDAIFICCADVLERSLARQTEGARHLASRTVLVDIVRTYAIEWAERLALAAVIGSEQYLRWKHSTDLGRSAALFGLKKVGLALGASWPDVPRLQGPNYALLSHPDFHELPVFLTAYLDAYTASL